MSRKSSKFRVLLVLAVAAVPLLAVLRELSIPSAPIHQDANKCRGADYVEKLGETLFRTAGPRTIALTIWNGSLPKPDNIFLHAIKQFIAIEWYSRMQTASTAMLFCESTSIKLDGKIVRGLPNIESGLVAVNLATNGNSYSLAICAGSEHFNFDHLRQTIHPKSLDLAQLCSPFFQRK
jgi:hypothetical protein